MLGLTICDPDSINRCVCVCVCVCLLGDVWRVGGKMEGEWLKERRIDFGRLSVHFTQLHKRQCRPAPRRQSPRLPQGVPDFLKGSM